MRRLIEQYCMRDNLGTYDPYDIWKTSYGIVIKKLFNRNRLLGIVPAAVLTLLDVYINNRLRFSYSKQEYPIVRALAALSLLNLYEAERKEEYLEYVKLHLEWLIANRSKNCIGYGWGLGFEHAVKADVIYDKDTPFVTITPYSLEAFIEYRNLSGDDSYDDAIQGILMFLEQDIKIMESTKHHLVTSYGTSKDRVVVNAVSYMMYMYALLKPYAARDNDAAIADKIVRLYQFVKDQQRDDGSWLYSPEGSSFIDCFHSCIILKNIIKTSRLFDLKGAESVISDGYRYLQENLLDERLKLFRRFSVKNKPTLVKFDLYDNAEMLNLASLINDEKVVMGLSQEIKQVFIRDKDIYSQIDIFSSRYNKNMLRWAVMPYLYALSSIYEGAGISK